MDNLTREDTVLTVQGTEIPRLGYGTWQVTGQGRDRRRAGRAGDRLPAHRHRARVRERGGGRRRARGRRRRPRRDLPHDEDLARRLRARQAQGGGGGLAAAAGTDYVDLLLLHWPSADVPVERSLQAMRSCRSSSRSATRACRTSPPGMLGARARRSRRCWPTRSSTTRSSPRTALLDVVGRARHHADRLLPARPRQGRRPPRAHADRRAVRQVAPARSRCAGCSTSRTSRRCRRRRATSGGGELPGLRLRALRRRPRADRRAAEGRAQPRTRPGRPTGTTS